MSKIKQVNYYGFDLEKVNKSLTGGLSYVGDACVDGTPVSIYSVANPDRSQGHKDFVILWSNAEGVMVAGMDPEQMAQHTKHEALQCLLCGTVVYSVHRHHMNECGCPNGAFADGGKDYFRYGAAKMEQTALGEVDVVRQLFSIEAFIVLSVPESGS